MPMAADSFARGWLLFLVQLPSKPSSARVALWRRLRAIGATTMVNGVWVLPDTAPHAALLGKLRERVLRQGGTAFVLSLPGSPPEIAETIVRHFRADRAREYDEFAERCTAFLDEVGKEARDFFPDERRQQSFTLMSRCRSALDGFAHAVYVAEGVQETAGDDSRPGRRRTPRPSSG